MNYIDISEGEAQALVFVEALYVNPMYSQILQWELSTRKGEAREVEFNPHL